MLMVGVPLYERLFSLQPCQKKSILPQFYPATGPPIRCFHRILRSPSRRWVLPRPGQWCFMKFKRTLVTRSLTSTGKPLQVALLSAEPLVRASADLCTFHHPTAHTFFHSAFRIPHSEIKRLEPSETCAVVDRATRHRPSRRICEAEWGAIWLREEDRITLAAEINMDPEHADFLRQHPLPLGSDTATGMTIEERTVQHILDSH